MTVLVYDGDCGFCSSAVRLLPRLRLRADAVVAWQHADLPALGLTAEQCRHEVQWVGPRGVSGGAGAVARLLQASGPLWWLVGTLLRLPPLSLLAALLYRVIAANRMRLPGGTPACGLPLPP